MGFTPVKHEEEPNAGEEVVGTQWRTSNGEKSGRTTSIAAYPPRTTTAPAATALTDLTKGALERLGPGRG